MDLVAGIDLGGTDTKFGLVNREGEVLTYSSIPTDSENDYLSFFHYLKEEILYLLNSLDGDYELAGLSVCAPSGNQYLGTIDDASNLNWPEKIPVSKILGSAFRLPVTVSNDANAAALGEMMYGAAKGKKNFICITLGTGLGCGVVVDGKLILGAHGHAGELGHVTVVQGGRKCTCGRYGCLETYASATGIVRTVLSADKNVLDSSRLSSFKPGKLDAKKITNAALKGDQLALDAFDFTGKMLGRKLADTVAFLNPEMIILSGGLMRSGDLLLKPTERYMNEHLLSVFKGSVEVRLSEMDNKKTTILGAAAFIWLKLDNTTTVTA